MEDIPQLQISTLFTEGISPLPLFGHSAILLSHNFLIIYGGAVEQGDKYVISGDLHLLSLQQRMWTPAVSFTGEIPSPRASHACTGIDPNRLLVHGGVIGAGAFADDELYIVEFELESARAKSTIMRYSGPSPGCRYAHTLTCMRSKLFLYGGTAPPGVCSDLWIFENCSWSRISLPENPEARCYHSSVAYTNTLGRDFLIIFGGRGKNQLALSDMWTLTAGGNGLWRWVWISREPIGRYMHVSVISGDDCFLIGGRGDTPGDVLPIVKMELGTCKRSTLQIHPAFRQSGACEAGKVYLMGGYEGKDRLTSAVTCVDLDPPIQSPMKRGRVSGPSTPQRIYCAKLHMSPYVIVSSTADYTRYHSLVRKVALNRLPTESKKLQPRSTSPGYSLASSTTDSAQNYVLSLFLRTNEDCFISAQDAQISKETVSALLDSIASVLEVGVETLELREPVKVFGGLHGQLNALLRYFREYGEPSEAPFTGDIDSTDYVFMGEHIGEGKMSVETLCVLLALKVKHPESVYLLRAHSVSPKRLQELSDECKLKFGEDPNSPDSVYFRLLNVLSSLPTQASIADTVYCCDSGSFPSSQDDSNTVTLRCEDSATGGLDICDQGTTVKFASAPSLPGEKKRPGCMIVVTKALQIVPKFLSPSSF